MTQRVVLAMINPNPPGSVPTVKQHLVAARMLCDWLVVKSAIRLRRRQARFTSRAMAARSRNARGRRPACKRGLPAVVRSCSM